MLRACIWGHAKWDSNVLALSVKKRFWERRYVSKNLFKLLGKNLLKIEVCDRLMKWKIGSRTWEHWTCSMHGCLWNTAQSLYDGQAVVMLDKKGWRHLAIKNLWILRHRTDLMKQWHKNFYTTRTKRHSISIYKSETTNTLCKYEPSNIPWVVIKHWAKHWNCLNFIQEYETPTWSTTKIKTTIPRTSIKWRDSFPR